MVKKCARHNIGIRRIATDDGSFLFQLLFTITVILAGIYLNLNALQWLIVAILSFMLLTSGFYRSAVHLLATYDDSISSDQAVRIKALSNIVVTFTAGLTFFSFLMIFVPKINQIL